MKNVTVLTYAGQNFTKKFNIKFKKKSNNVLL